MSKLDDIIKEYSGRMRPQQMAEEIKALFQELIGPHESLSEQQVKDGRIYVIGDPQRDAVDRYRDELSRKVEEL